MRYKLKTLEELFPEVEAEVLKEEKVLEYGKMFKISESEQKKVVQTIDDMVSEMKSQREELMNFKAEAVRSYEGIEENNGPWPGSSNISTMVTTIASDTMHSKLFPMVWNLNALHFEGTEKHDEEIAKNNEVLVKWALTKDMENTQDKVDDIIHRLVVEGTVAIKRVWEKYYTYVTRVIPKSVTAKGEMKYETVYDRIHRERCRWVVKDIDHVYFTFNAENEQRADIIDEIYVNIPMLREMKARCMFLPTIEIEDLIKAVEKSFDPEGTIKARHEASGIEAYYARLDSYPIKLYEGYIKYLFEGDAEAKDCVFLTLPSEGIYLCGKPLHCVSRIGKKPWTIRGFLRRPGMMYGKGVPELVRHLHKEMNAIHNQRIDAGNMVIAPFFFFRAASGMDPSEISVRPATGIPLDDPQRDVFFPDYNAGRLTVSFQEEKIIMDFIEKLTYLTPASLGRETAERPTARGTLAVIAQGEQKFGALGTRVQRIFNDLITGTRQDYEEYFPQDLQQRILGKNGNPVWGKISPEMIAGQYDASMTLDLSSTDLAFDRQADQLIFQTMIQDPMINQNPAYAWELRANYLRSFGKKDVEKLIGPKPDNGANPGDMDEENIRLSQEQQVELLPGDNDVEHMNSHSQYKREHFKELTPESLRNFTIHNLDHMQSYQKKLQEQALLQQKGGQSGTSGTETIIPGFTKSSSLGNVLPAGTGGQSGQPIQGPSVY